MWIKKQSHLSTSVYDSLKSFADFKIDMKNMYIRAQKDPEKKWTTLPFIAIDEVVFMVLYTWPLEWWTLDLGVCDEMEIQRQKAAIKLLAQQKHNE